jgi:lipopolysaccharide export system permease protein
MMKILERYITKTIVQATVITGLIITSILFIMSMMGEAKAIGVGDYSLLESVIYVLLRMPAEIYHFSPLLILLGSIIGLSILSSHRELAVMRASGFSICRIMSSVLLAALMMILFISLIGEWAGPGLSYKAVIKKENAQHGDQAVTTATGSWFHIDNNFIYVKSVIDKYHFNDVTRYQFENHHKLQAVYAAKTLVYENKKWMLKSVVKTSFYPNRTKSVAYAELPWDLQFNTNLLNTGVFEPSELSLSKVARFARYLEQNGLQSSEYRFNFWQRIFQPFSSLVMIFLAIPFVLGAMSTSTMGWRIVVGILVGFVFFILN